MTKQSEDFFKFGLGPILSIVSSKTKFKRQYGAIVGSFQAILQNIALENLFYIIGRSINCNIWCNIDP